MPREERKVEQGPGQMMMNEQRTMGNDGYVRNWFAQSTILYSTLNQKKKKEKKKESYGQQAQSFLVTWLFPSGVCKQIRAFLLLVSKIDFFNQLNQTLKIFWTSAGQEAKEEITTIYKSGFVSLFYFSDNLAFYNVVGTFS